jgi:hypothetical protein
MPRRLGIVAQLCLGGVLTLFAGGCSDDDADVAKVRAVEQQALDAVDGVLHDIAERADMEFEVGNRSAAICGESYAPRGVNLRVFVRLGPPAELTLDDAMAVAGEALAGDSWEVDPTRRERLVIATRDDVEMRIEFGIVVQVDITAGCIETAGGVAREIAEEPSEELTWD